MNFVLAGCVFAGLLPIGLAFWAHRRTSLAHALLWAFVAWASWIPAVLMDDPTISWQPARYCAMCLIGCAGVAVLGARRPNVNAWNFVVLGLLAVMLLPLVETQVLGTRSTEGLRAVFLGGTIAVGLLNYFPTRLAPAAVILLIACAGQMACLFEPAWLPLRPPTWCVDAILATAPWIAWLSWRSKGEVSAFDRVWLDFRDSWGLVWSQRVREQFNLATSNADSTATLTWRGLVGSDGDAATHETTLRAVLQRFL